MILGLQTPGENALQLFPENEQHRACDAQYAK
jgi:hypothetical protein